MADVPPPANAGAPRLPPAAAPTAALAATKPQADADPAPAAPPLRLIASVEPSVSNEWLDTAHDELLVKVAFTVRPDGQVTEAQVLSSTDRRLNRPVLRALKSWRYAPIPQARQHTISFAFVAAP